MWIILGLVAAVATSISILLWVLVVGERWIDRADT